MINILTKLISFVNFNKITYIAIASLIAYTSYLKLQISKCNNVIEEKQNLIDSREAKSLLDKTKCNNAKNEQMFTKIKVDNEAESPEDFLLKLKNTKKDN